MNMCLGNVDREGRGGTGVGGKGGTGTAVARTGVSLADAVAWAARRARVAEGVRRRPCWDKLKLV